MMASPAQSLLLLVFCSLANGLLDPALTPPMGWRSWNCFNNNIDQKKIKQQIDALADGPLLQLGYGRIGTYSQPCSLTV